MKSSTINRTPSVFQKNHFVILISKKYELIRTKKNNNYGKNK